MKKNILFVCKYNRFRSRVAEAYFKKINKNIKVKSAGIFKGNPLKKTQKDIAKKMGIDISGVPKTISSKLLSKTEIIIVVANDVPKEIFKYEGKYVNKIILWKVKDNFNGNSKEIEKIIKQIIKKVDNLNKTLKRSK